MSDLTYEFEAEIWVSQGKGAWWFVTLPEDVSEHIKFFSGQKVAFGSVRVKVQIGDTKWQTSLFPSNELSAYTLPIKADVRKREALKSGQMTNVIIGLDM